LRGDVRGGLLADVQRRPFSLVPDFFSPLSRRQDKHDGRDDPQEEGG
jgi:hypothetical protein